MRNLLLSALLSLTVGCTADVAPGYVGQIKTISGFTGEILQPGKHTCWGRDQMWRVENRDQTFDIPLNILLEQDQVNFGVTVSITVTLKKGDGVVSPLFNKVKPGPNNSITLTDVFNVYAARILNSVPRQVVRPRSVEQILIDVSIIESEIETAVVTELGDTPVQVIGLSLTNFDFPDFITKAQEQAKQREIEIKEEEAKARKEVVRLEGKKRTKQLEYDIEVIEAKTIADANRLVGESLMGESGARYLRWHEIKVYGQAASGPNNTILLPMSILEDDLVRETPIRNEMNEAFKR